MNEKDKESVLDFHGNELLEASGLTYSDIEKRCGREDLQYRTIYSYFLHNKGKAKVETAARIGIAMGVSLNDLYTPKDLTWPSPVPITTVSETDSDLQTIFDHLTKDVLSQLALDLIKDGRDDLGELCNQYSMKMSIPSLVENEGAPNE